MSPLCGHNLMVYHAQQSLFQTLKSYSGHAHHQLSDRGTYECTHSLSFRFSNSNEIQWRHLVNHGP